MPERFTNEAYFEISEEQKQDEQRILGSLYERHTTELVESGAVTRVVGGNAAKVALNNVVSAIPFRRPTWSSPKLQAQSLQNPDNLRLQVAMDKLDPSYDLSIVLSDLTERETILSDCAGILFSNTAVARLNVGKYLPEPGVHIDDLRLIEQQLAEVESFKILHNLVIIDPATLSAGPGETYFT